MLQPDIAIQLTQVPSKPSRLKWKLGKLRNRPKIVLHRYLLLLCPLQILLFGCNSATKKSSNVAFDGVDVERCRKSLQVLRLY